MVHLVFAYLSRDAFTPNIKNTDSSSFELGLGHYLERGDNFIISLMLHSLKIINGLFFCNHGLVYFEKWVVIFSGLLTSSLII